MLICKLCSFLFFTLITCSYTHFTSPIRRYPDVVVHRLLAASLGYLPEPGYNTKELDKITARSNFTKTGAKTCSEQSGEIFFGAIVRVGFVYFEVLIYDHSMR